MAETIESGEPSCDQFENMRREGFLRPVDSRPRVAILSDVRLYREGLEIALTRTGGVEVVGATAPRAALAHIGALTPDVVLLDAVLIRATTLPRDMRQTLPSVKIVAFAVSDSKVIECAEAGICGYVNCEGSAEDIVTAVHCAMRGEVICSPRLTALLFERVATLSAGRTQPEDAVRLTRREREIVPLIESGLSNKEIARRLHVGTATVKNHIHNILEKLQIHRRAEVTSRISGPRTS